MRLFYFWNFLVQFLLLFLTVFCYTRYLFGLLEDGGCVVGYFWIFSSALSYVLSTA